MIIGLSLEDMTDTDIREYMAALRMNFDHQEPLTQSRIADTIIALKDELARRNPPPSAA